MDTKGPMMVAAALGIVAAVAFLKENQLDDDSKDLASAASELSEACQNDAAECDNGGPNPTNWQRRSTSGGALFISAGD